MYATMDKGNLREQKHMLYPIPQAYSLRTQNVLCRKLKIVKKNCCCDVKYRIEDHL